MKEISFFIKPSFTLPSQLFFISRICEKYLHCFFQEYRILTSFADKQTFESGFLKGFSNMSSGLQSTGTDDHTIHVVAEFLQFVEQVGIHIFTDEEYTISDATDIGSQ